MNRQWLTIWVLLVIMGGRALAQEGGVYNLSWGVIGSGGATWSTGGDFQLGSTIGQPLAFGASPLRAGGAFSLTDGFWHTSSLISTIAKRLPLPELLNRVAERRLAPVSVEKAVSLGVLPLTLGLSQQGLGLRFPAKGDSTL